ncbi:MAG: altronate dehydratase family protein [Clostridia bacterium]|nr:altronate dehydratase family protein [Clostridia bacterium]
MGGRAQGIIGGVQAVQAVHVADSLVIHYADNVGVAIGPLWAGERHQGVLLSEDIPMGHKFALRDIQAGEQVVKFRASIGHADADITAGAWVHIHNCKTNLVGAPEYVYQPVDNPLPPYVPARGMFAGYLRADGKVGIRNELWILPMEPRFHETARRLAQKATDEFGYLAPDGIQCFAADQPLMASLVAHPNAGGVLVLGPGSETLGEVDESRVKFLPEGEIEAGMAYLAELAARIPAQPRTMVPLSKLVVGLQCGGNDRLSGITANPLLGAVSDALIACGASTVLTEVPEMFGTETLLMSRCYDVRVFAKAVKLINDYKRGLQCQGQAIYQNPSLDDRAGGITTLEEKSLGCTQKGGNGPVADVLAYAQQLREPGLNLLSGPGDDLNDLNVMTALAAAGCQLILYSTGGGATPDSPVPVIKVASNSELARREPGWIDFNAGLLVEGVTMTWLLEELLDKMIRVAEGERTRSRGNR